MLSGWKTGHLMLQGDVLHAAAGLPRRAALLADGAVRLRHQADDRMRAGEQCLKSRLGEQAGAHHDETHKSSSAISAQRSAKKRSQRDRAIIRFAHCCR